MEGYRKAEPIIVEKKNPSMFHMICNATPLTFDAFYI